MSWNGTGTYVLNPAYTPEAPGNVVDSTRYNGALTDIANGITASLAKNGENVPTANLGMGGFKHTNVAAAAVAGEYVEYAQMLALTSEINVLATTVYTTSSGTHIFNASAKSYKYVVVGGGGGGAGGGTASCTGGSAGETVEGTAFVINASETYAVGAAAPGGTGAVGTNGNRTRFGTIVAQGGTGGIMGASDGPAGGGILAAPCEGRTPGGAGGYGGGPPPTAAAAGGRAPGYPTPLARGSSDNGTLISSGNTSGNRCGGGGSSLYGRGGDGSNGATAGGAGTGYGSAGGGSDSGTGGAGMGGYIKIVEFG